MAVAILNVRLPHFTPEMRLVLACSRAPIRGEESSPIEKLSHGPINWETFIKLADRHRVYPMVYRNLSRDVGNGVPKHVLVSLRNRFEKNTRRSLELTAELARLTKLFQQGGIPVMALKGPAALALQVYGDLGLRHAGDLDLLVHSDYFEGVDQMLCRNGYRRTNSPFFLSPRKQRYSERMFYHLNYLRNDGRVSVEPHWSLIRNSHLFPMDINQLWARQKTTMIAGTPVKTLPLEETVLYLCMHGATHVWLRLFWLCDLAQILNKNNSVDWTRLMARATELVVQRPAAQGLVLSNLLLGSHLPDPVRAYAERERVMPRLISAGLNGILMRLPDSGARTARVLMHEKLNEIKLRRELRYKLHCFATSLTSTQDWNIVR